MGKISISGRPRKGRVYNADGSYQPLHRISQEYFAELTDQQLKEKEGIARIDGYLYDVKHWSPEEWAETDIYDILENRDAFAIARRNRRRVFAEQDDRRLKDPNIEDFNHVPERQYHDRNGRVREISQRDLPINVNVSSENRPHRVKYYRNREIIDKLRASICGKRKARREVLFATKKTGKGSRARRHLWSKISKIICK